MSVTMKWFGHACFSFTGENGVVLLVDPFDDNIGYRIPNHSCDLLLLTRPGQGERFVSDGYNTVSEPGEFELNGIPIIAKSLKDISTGESSLIFRFSISEISFAFFGTLNHTPSPAEIDFLKDVDCTMVPVGGHVTLDAKSANSIVDELKPSYVFPISYKTNALNLAFDHVEDFLVGKSDVIRQASPLFTVNADNLPSRTTVVVMDFV